MPEPTHVVSETGTGTGPPLVLVHGVGLDHTMWDLVVERLRAAPGGPTTIVRYDLMGHGRSAPIVEGTLSLDDCIAQLLAVVERWGDAGPPDVCGLSLGGTIVRGAVARHPARFGRVVVANTVFDRDATQRGGAMERLRLARDQGMAPIADLAIDRWFTGAFRAAHPDRVTRIHRRLVTTALTGYLPAYRVFVDGDPAIGGLLPELTNPALFVTGDRDTGSTAAMSHAMAALAPESVAHVMSDTGHLPPIERPAEFTAVLTDFLERSDP